MRKILAATVVAGALLASMAAADATPTPTCSTTFDAYKAAQSFYDTYHAGHITAGTGLLGGSTDLNGVQPFASLPTASQLAYERAVTVAIRTATCHRQGP